MKTMFWIPPDKADAQAELEKRQARAIVNRAAMRQVKANHRN
jgi:hypothetical protein